MMDEIETARGATSLANMAKLRCIPSRHPPPPGPIFLVLLA